MSVELITDSAAIFREIGLVPEENTLQSGIFLEGPRDRLPVLVKHPNGSYALLVRRLELGNYYGFGRGAELMRRRKVRLVAYDPYFTMSDNGSEYVTHATEGYALRDELNVTCARVHLDMPYGRYLRIQSLVQTELADTSPSCEVFYGYTVDEAYAARTFNQVCPQDVQLAMDILTRCTHVDEQGRLLLHKYMNAPRINPFTLLRTMMQEAGLSQIWGDTQLTIHTFTAIPWDEIKAGQMFVHLDGSQVRVFSTEKLDKPFLTQTQVFESYPAMVKQVLGSNSVGIEEKSLPIGRVLDIGSNRCTNASALLTLWRDRHAYQFLPYYIINGVGNIYAMEAACTWARQAVEQGVHATERDVDKAYVNALQDFSRQQGLEALDLVSYFVVLHAGSRCPFPALSSDYVLSPDMNTLKIDSGALLFKNGILMSASDQCRCYSLTPEAQWVYDVLANNMRRDVIANLRGGMRGKDVFWSGLEPLCRTELLFKEKGMLAKDFSLRDQYNRNIGHTIDKEESCSVSADRSDERIFEPYMIGCIEYQWPYQDYCIGVEDMFFIAPEGAIDFVY